MTVVQARDLAPDGGFHTLEIELRGKVRTAQIDQLQFSLPAGSRLEVEDLQFCGGETVYTLFNASYRTVRFSFLGKERSLGPRDVDVATGV